MRREKARTARVHKLLVSLSEQARRSSKAVMVSTLRGEAGEVETVDPAKYISGSLALLSTCVVTFSKPGMQVSCLKAPPAVEVAEVKPRVVERVGVSGEGGGAEERGKKTLKNNQGAKAVFPEALLVELVRHLLGSPGRNINGTAEDFTQEHLGAGAQRVAVKREIKRIAEFCNRKWLIRPEVLQAVNITDPDSLRPADLPPAKRQKTPKCETVIKPASEGPTAQPSKLILKPPNASQAPITFYTTCSNFEFC